MKVSGKILKINNDLGYGFIKNSKLGDIFFSTETNFKGTSFDSIKLDTQVEIDVVETDRGLFATNLSLFLSKKTSSVAETSI